MSGVFRNIDPPPPHRPARVYPPPRLLCGGRALARWRGGGVEIVRKTPDTALYSIFVSLCDPILRWIRLSLLAQRGKVNHDGDDRVSIENIFF